MSITTSSFAKALWPGVNSWYGRAYDEIQPKWDKMFDTYKSRKNYEEDVGISGFGLAPVKTEGQAISYDSERQAFIKRYTHVAYGLGFIVTREMFEDDLYDVVGQRKAKALAFSMRQTKEVIGANVYNRAFTSTYVGGDGKELLATDHPNLSGGTYANELTTAADISEAALEQACIDISRMTNDRGLRIALTPQGLILPPELEFEATRILKSTGQYDTANNATNALRALGKFPKGMIVSPYLTDADAWFIRTDCPDGMKYFERRADEFDMDNDFDTENAKFKATARYSFGWTDPRSLFGSPGA